jgi:lipopolysaccharide export LptBFGC system permease protein LptF
MPVVFHLFYQYQDLSELVSGTVMIISASVVIHRIHNKSKNTFAYILMGLSLTVGVSNIGYAFSEAFRKEVTLPDRVYHFES